MAVNLHTTHFRFGNDDGTEAAHTFKANEDVSISLLKDAIFLLRFTVQETGGTLASNVDNQFQYNLNGAGWNNITTSSAVVRAVAVGAFVDGANCTKRLSGTGTFESSGAGCTEDGLSGGNANDIAASGNSETECGLQLQAGDVANGDTIEFRLTSPDFTITNDVVPTITVLDNVTVTPGLGDATLTGFAPTVTAGANTTVTPGLGSAVLDGLAPSAIADNLIATGLGQLNATGFEPTVTASSGTVATPALGELTATGLAPTVTASDHQTVTTGLGSATLTGLAPTAQTPVVATPALGNADLAGLAPSAIADNKITIGLGEATLNGLAPLVIGGVGAEPGVGSLDATGFSPTITVSNNQTVTPGLGSVDATGFAPTITAGAHYVARPDAGSLALEGYAPTVLGSAARISESSTSGHQNPGIPAHPVPLEESIVLVAPMLVMGEIIKIVSLQGELVQTLGTELQSRVSDFGGFRATLRLHDRTRVEAQVHLIAGLQMEGRIGKELELVSEIKRVNKERDERIAWQILMAEQEGVNVPWLE